jgi:BTB/POZ domain-containing protein 3/6
MKCLTFLLLLPETLKKSKKTGKHTGSLPVCYEILTLSLKKKMAAELYPATTNLTNNGTTVTASDKKSDVQVTQSTTTATTPTTQQNINNNVDPPSWQSSHPTLRER